MTHESPVNDNFDTIEVINQELIKKHQIESTPFLIIEIDQKYFGAIANYRLTQEYETFEECYDELTKITWNNITTLIITITEILKKQNEILKNN